MIVKYVKELNNLDELSNKELVELYKKYKKERLVFVYSIKYKMKEEIDLLKKEIEHREKDLIKQLSQAQYDRENCELGYNEAGLSMH